MKDLKGTKTEANLNAAFAGESMARNKYTYYASAAKKAGYEQIAAIFLETAENEKEHAKIWFKMLGGIGDTAQNLAAAAAGENFEWSQMYKSFAEDARAEGFDEIAAKFELIASIEKHHDERYNKLIQNVGSGEVFARVNENTWICLNCGFEVKGTSAPEVCPACAHPQAYFQIKSTNY